MLFRSWYTGRICHIHFQVYVSSAYAAVSQLTFDIPAKNAIYAANPALYTRGADPTSYAADNIFSDGYSLQLATLTPNTVTGGYDSFLEVTIQGNGTTTGLGHIEKENNKNFSLGQNYPNPYQDYTDIPLSLKFPSDVILKIYDLNGKEAALLVNEHLSAGDHSFRFLPAAWRLPGGTYVYQLQVRNVNGE